MDVGVENRRKVAPEKQIVDDRNQGSKQDRANPRYRSDHHCNDRE
jgi:hypothetical protein